MCTIAAHTNEGKLHEKKKCGGKASRIGLNAGGSKFRHRARFGKIATLTRLLAFAVISQLQECFFASFLRSVSHIAVIVSCD
jgi:hypothetical protein